MPESIFHCFSVRCFSVRCFSVINSSFSIYYFSVKNSSFIQIYESCFIYGFAGSDHEHFSCPHNKLISCFLHTALPDLYHERFHWQSAVT